MPIPSEEQPDDGVRQSNSRESNYRSTDWNCRANIIVEES